MFISAVISAAFVENDIKEIINIGLNQIPVKCRLAESIKRAIKIAKNQLELVEEIWNEYNNYNSVHTIL